MKVVLGCLLGVIALRCKGEGKNMEEDALACIWCDQGGPDVYAKAVWSHGRWQDVHCEWGRQPPDPLDRERHYVEELLRVAALERPGSALPTLEQAMELWAEQLPADFVPLSPVIRSQGFALAEFRLLNRGLTEQDARDYLRTRDATPRDHVDDWQPLPRQVGWPERTRADGGREGGAMPDPA